MCHLVQAVHHDVSPRHGLPRDVQHKPHHPAVHGPEDGQHGAVVVAPLTREMSDWRSLTAAHLLSAQSPRSLSDGLIPPHLYRQLHCVGEEVGEVLETPGHHLQLIPSVVANAEGLRVAGTLTGHVVIMSFRVIK